MIQVQKAEEEQILHPDPKFKNIIFVHTDKYNIYTIKTCIRDTDLLGDQN